MLTVLVSSAVVVKTIAILLVDAIDAFFFRCANSFTCRLLHDISQEHQSAKALLDNDKTEATHISALLCHENQLWVGTIDGYAMIVVFAKVTLVHLAISSCTRSSRLAQSCGASVR